MHAWPNVAQKSRDRDGDGYNGRLSRGAGGVTTQKKKPASALKAAKKKHCIQQGDKATAATVHVVPFLAVVVLMCLQPLSGSA